jgi:tetratricopeptide (TPR) repeat protein
MRIILGAVLLTMAGPVVAEQKFEIGYDRGALGYEALMSDNNKLALEQLARDRADVNTDPAKLINIGRAYNRLGDYKRAEEAFLAALNCKEHADLVLADGREMHSRKAAKLALRQLRASKKQ